MIEDIEERTWWWVIDGAVKERLALGDINGASGTKIDVAVDVTVTQASLELNQCGRVRDIDRSATVNGCAAIRRKAGPNRPAIVGNGCTTVGIIHLYTGRRRTFNIGVNQSCVEDVCGVGIVSAEEGLDTEPSAENAAAIDNGDVAIDLAVL